MSKEAEASPDPRPQPSWKVAWPDLKAVILPALCNVLSILIQVRCSTASNQTQRNYAFLRPNF